ncbi:molybdenum cofactor biosynthesis protein MoaE [Methanofollis tationis]|uniref:Molybdenum cofactor biosynthesis protein MoaE n=1 Tax=Methanofollis tationis TaxID=81417 RepID=A0A7K4HQF3_9EURY|nr:molybdenum cofactor biosynthesis protein MoaE [Methanofollis tationis]NVO67140.1 molybdenum cofactor biosynthesis protein MoaE [Methanofollis tationis]
MIDVRHDDFNINEMIERAKDPSMGALVTFLGVVRDDEIERIELEAYREAAVQELEAIRNEAFAAHEIASVAIVHRIGPLQVGENILLIIVGAGHRREAFAACEYILEEIKRRLPIWKKEFEKGGGTRWVPGNAG